MSVPCFPVPHLNCILPLCPTEPSLMLCIQREVCILASTQFILTLRSISCYQFIPTGFVMEPNGNYHFSPHIIPSFSHCVVIMKFRWEISHLQLQEKFYFQRLIKIIIFSLPPVIGWISESVYRAEAIQCTAITWIS